MTYQLVGKKLENGNFKLAIVANGEFSDVVEDGTVETYVIEAVAAVTQSMKPGERLSIMFSTGSGTLAEKQ